MAHIFNTFFKAPVKLAYVTSDAVSTVQGLKDFRAEFRQGVIEKFKDDIPVFCHLVTVRLGTAISNSFPRVSTILQLRYSNKCKHANFSSTKQPTIRELLKCLAKSNSKVCNQYLSPREYDLVMSALRMSCTRPDHDGSTFWLTVFGDTIRKIEAECDELQKVHPYLFKKPEDLFYEAITNQ